MSTIFLKTGVAGLFGGPRVQGLQMECHCEAGSEHNQRTAQDSSTEHVTGRNNQNGIKLREEGGMKGT